MPQIIFATAFDQYAVRAFDVNAIDYLLKPFDRARVLQALERARQRLQEAHQLEQEPLPENGAWPKSSRRMRVSMRCSVSSNSNRRPCVRAAERLFCRRTTGCSWLDQKDICFAAIEEGIISVVTPTLEGQSKCRTIEELLELLDPAGFLESPPVFRGQHQPHQRSGALVQEQLSAAHG